MTTPIRKKNGYSYGLDDNTGMFVVLKGSRVIEYYDDEESAIERFTVEALGF